MLAARLRSVHLEMVGAVLAGEGLERVAELAAEAAEAPVWIELPRLAAAVGSTPAGAPLDAPGPSGAVVPVLAGDEAVGEVRLLGPGDPEAAEVLQIAALACLTELAISDARDEAVATVRGGLLEDVRAGRVDETALVRRAARLGCDLSQGVVALAAEPSTTRPRHLVASLSGEWPGMLGEWRDDGRLVALLPARGDGAATLRHADALAGRLRRMGTAATSSFHARAGAATNALAEAEIVLDVARRDGSAQAADLSDLTSRLLLRVFTLRPDEVRAFHDETVGRIDSEDLLATLRRYVELDYSMAAAAAALHVHRHTVAYRLDRIRGLTGLDPLSSEGRERLGLGLKARRILGAR